MSAGSATFVYIAAPIIPVFTTHSLAHAALAEAGGADRYGCVAVLVVAGFECATATTGLLPTFTCHRWLVGKLLAVQFVTARICAGLKTGVCKIFVVIVANVTFIDELVVPA